LTLICQKKTLALAKPLSLFHRSVGNECKNVLIESRRRPLPETSGIRRLSSLPPASLDRQHSSSNHPEYSEANNSSSSNSRQEYLVTNSSSNRRRLYSARHNRRQRRFRDLHRSARVRLTKPPQISVQLVPIPGSLQRTYLVAALSPGRPRSG